MHDKHPGDYVETQEENFDREAKLLKIYKKQTKFEHFIPGVLVRILPSCAYN